MENLTTRIFILGMALFCSCFQIQAQNYWVYISSPGNDQQAGIGIYEWNSVIGQLSLVAQDSTVLSSSYLTIDQINSRLYNINRDGIQAFNINPKSGQLALINQLPHTGNGPCYVSLSNDHRFLMVAYYSSGSVATYDLSDEGQLVKVNSQIIHNGSSINKDRQEKAHAHLILPAPAGDLVMVTDLGIDQVLTYPLSREGQLDQTPVSITKVTPGYGPRHLAFHPNGRYVYLLAELTGHVMSYRFDASKGIGEMINDVNILPEDFSGFNKSADILVSADGQYMYASNRGDNSIAVCAINQDSGELSLVDIQSCGGLWPRAFAFDPTGKYLLVANKRSNQLSVFRINAETGKLDKKSEIATTKDPQCIRFLKKKEI